MTSYMADYQDHIQGTMIILLVLNLFLLAVVTCAWVAAIKAFFHFLSVHSSVCTLRVLPQLICVSVDLFSVRS